MSASLYTGEEEHRPMDVEFSTPDPKVYPRQVFTSFSDMISKCPRLEQISDAVKGGYIPYTVRTLYGLQVYPAVDNTMVSKYINVVNVINDINFIYIVCIEYIMAENKDPDAIRNQRVSNRNIERIVKHGDLSVEDSFNDALTRVLDEYESMKKKRKTP